MGIIEQFKKASVSLANLASQGKKNLNQNVDRYAAIRDKRSERQETIAKSHAYSPENAAQLKQFKKEDKFQREQAAYEAQQYKQAHPYKTRGAAFARRQYRRAFNKPRGGGGKVIVGRLQSEMANIGRSAGRPQRRVARARPQYQQNPQQQQMMAERMAMVRAARQMPQQQVVYQNPNLSQQSPYRTQPQMTSGMPARQFQRPVAYIFKGSGVNPLGQMNAPIQPGQIPPNYRLVTDGFTGRRTLVPIRPELDAVRGPENWIR